LTYSNHFDSIMSHLVYQADYVVIDLGPSLPPITHKMISNCDEVVVLIDPNPIIVIRTQKLIAELKQRGFGEGRLHAVLYNRQRIDAQYSLSHVQQDLRYPISIVFTAAPELNMQSVINGIPLVISNPDNITSQQFFRLADNITKRVYARE
jgi:MinD-like ATPase involved in chromosome partitioning or flagellar assembly